MMTEMMTARQNEVEPWQLAGFTHPETGRMHGRVGQILVPRPNETLSPDGTDLILGQTGTGVKFKPVVFEQFLRLGGAAPERIVAYVRKWGELSGPGDPEDAHEPIQKWYYLARRASAI